MGAFRAWIFIDHCTVMKKPALSLLILKIMLYCHKNKSNIVCYYFWYYVAI